VGASRESNSSSSENLRRGGAFEGFSIPSTDARRERAGGQWGPDQIECSGVNSARLVVRRPLATNLARVFA